MSNIFGQEDYQCSRCDHYGSQHFTATDSIGFFAFCMIDECSCFIDERDNEQTS